MSAAYSDKSGGGLRQRSLADGLGFAGDAAPFVAARDSVSGMEYLYRGRDLAEKGIRLELGAYQRHVLLDFRDMREDADHPWGALCDQLGGRGVSSLSDAMRDLQLKPVHDRLCALLDRTLAQQIADSKVAKPKVRVSTAKTTPKTAAKEPAPSNQIIEDATARVRSFLDCVHQVASPQSESAFGVTAADKWRGTQDDALQQFRGTLSSAFKLPQVEALLSEPCPNDACAVLPGSGTPPASSAAIWETVLAWAALRAAGAWIDPYDCETAATKVFDNLRLRQPMAQAFEAAGWEGEECWRAAARVRALLAHAAWAPGSRVSSMHPPFTWLHDPDVGWLIGVHQHQGTRYFVKEPFERLLWWMALPALVRLAESPDASKVRSLESEIRARLESAAAARYRLEALFEIEKKVEV